MIKADLAQLEHLSRRVGSCSSDVEDLKTNLSSLLAGTDWEGGAATRVRTGWDSEFRPALDSLAAALLDMSAEVNNRMIRLDAAGN
jgi:type VII secretion system (Wss) protein ESAT-6